MAFGGILLANFIFILLLIIFILFIISLLLFIIFTLIRIFSKNKKWKKILQLITGILTIIFFIPLLLTKIFLSSNQYEKVEYNGKQVKVEKNAIDKFYREITFCDIDELDKALKKNPELLNSKSLEGTLPIGVSIEYKKLECIKYFINKGQDINKITNSSTWGTLEYMFYYDYYDREIINYILDYTNVDVNKRHKALPVAQLYIKLIKRDREISEEELTIFKKLLDKGLDLSLTDGDGTDTYTYVEDLSDSIVNIDKLRELVNSKKSKY